MVARQRRVCRSTSTDTANTRTGAKVQELTQADVDKLSARSDLTNVQPAYQLSVKYMTFQGSTKHCGRLRWLLTIQQFIVILLRVRFRHLGHRLVIMMLFYPVQFADTLGQSAASLIGKQVTLTIAKANSTPTTDQINQILATQGVAGLSRLTQNQTENLTFTITGLAQKSSTALSGGTSLQVSPTIAAIRN